MAGHPKIEGFQAIPKEMISSEIINRMADVREEKIIKVLQWLIDNGQIKLIENKYSWIV